MEALCKEQGINVSPADIRRNLVLRGVQLNRLVDKKFKVGEVTLRGIRLCEPCQYLAKERSAGGATWFAPPRRVAG